MIYSDLQMGREQKEKRRGGARDDSEIYISYTRDRLLRMIVCREAKMGVIYPHDFVYRFKGQKSLPFLWRKIKKIIRTHIDGWQQELPLF